MDNEIGIAIIGCGYWGINYVRVFTELPNARVVVVCDFRGERLQEVARRFPGIALADSLADALQNRDVQAAVVCTEPTAHFAVTRDCLLAGKHVLVEKPVTVTEEECHALMDLARARELVLMVGHTFLFNSGIRKVKEYIALAKLSQVYYLYARRTNLGPIRKDVNALWDLATHDISIFNYLLGERPQWVSAVGANILQNGHEDVGFVSVGYRGNVLGHIHVSWVDPNKVREVVVVGDNMRIVFNDLNPQEQVRVFEKGVRIAPREAPSYGEYHLGIRDGDIISPKIEVAEPLKAQCSHFLDCVLNGCTPLSGGPEGLAVVQTLTAINRSLAQHGAPVEVNCAYR